MRIDFKTNKLSQFQHLMSCLPCFAKHQILFLFTFYTVSQCFWKQSCQGILDLISKYLLRHQWLYHLTFFYVFRNTTPGTLMNSEKQMTCLRRCPRTKTSNLRRKAPNDLKPPPSKCPCWTPLSSKEKLRYASWKAFVGTCFLELAGACFEQTVENQNSFFPLL